MKKRILSFLLALLMVFSLLPLSALADPEVEMGVETIDEERELIVDEGICGAKLTWVLNDDGVLTIDGTGDMKNYSSKAPWDSYRNGISIVVIGDKVTSIGDGAFKNCTKLSGVFYCGSKSQWNNISIGENNDMLLSAQMHYNYAPPEISIQPESIAAAVGTTEFSVTAVGEGLSYQWQYQKKGSSEWINSSTSSGKTATFSVNAREEINGYKYRCIVRDAIGKSTTSKTATLTVVPEITQQPANLKAACGTTGRFSVTATGESLSYQWQYQKKGSSEWINSGATSGKTATLSVSAREDTDGCKYRCKVTNSCGNSVMSKVVSLTVTAAVTKQPTDLTAASGTTGKLSISAEGEGLTYQWQFLKPGGTWTDSTAKSGKTATFSVSAREAINGYKYRCVVSDANGVSVTSDIATLTVTPNITKQPADLKAKSGTTGKFSVTAAGDGLSYQWQYQTTGGGEWTNSTAKSAKTATLSVSVRSAIEGYKYRCIITNSCENSVISDEATLSVTAAITKQPANLKAASGTTGKINITADGVGLTYQWQYQKKGSSTWTNSGAKSAKSASFSVSAREEINGYKYRCIVKDAKGSSITSSTVTLTVTANITKQPTNLKAKSGTTGKISITAKGEGLTYQWQYLKPGGSWTNSTAKSAKTATFSVSARSAINGYKYRCIVKNSCGNTVTSSVVTLTVTPVITKQPTSLKAAGGTTGKFSVTADGVGLTYQWQFLKPGGSWTNSTAKSGKTATFSVSVRSAINSYKYRCIVKDANGNSVTSSIATLTVK